MNERIRELAEQAREVVLTQMKIFQDADMSQRAAKWAELYNTKFAQLIVKECLFIIDDERKPDMVNRTELWHQIVEHFRVEE